MQVLSRGIILAVIGLIFLAPQVARAQTCLGSQLTYFVRDEKGKPMDEVSRDLWYDPNNGASSVFKWEFRWEDLSKAHDDQKIPLPQSISQSKARLAVFGTTGMCSFSAPVKLQLKLKGEIMTLVFNAARAHDQWYTIDSLPFQPGAFQMDLPLINPRSEKFYPAANWKKIGAEAEQTNARWEKVRTETEYLAGLTLMFIRGHVFDALTKKPVAGADVHLIGGMPTKLKEAGAAKTDSQGWFEMKGLRSDYMAAAYQAALVAEHPNFASSYVLIFDKSKKPSESSETTEPEFKSIADATVELVPLTTVSGRAIDETTGGVPGDLDKLEITIRYRKEGYLGGNILVPAGEVKTKLNPDGTFTVRTAVGKNSISAIGGSYYFGDWGDSSFEIDVPKEGRSDLVLKLKRRSK